MFPSIPAVYSEPSFTEEKDEFFGGQVISEAYAKSAERIKPVYYGPLHDQTDTIIKNALKTCWRKSRPAKEWESAMKQIKTLVDRARKRSIPRQLIQPVIRPNPSREEALFARIRIYPIYLEVHSWQTQLQQSHRNRCPEAALVDGDRAPVYGLYVHIAILHLVRNFGLYPILLPSICPSSNGMHSDR